MEGKGEGRGGREERDIEKGGQGGEEGREVRGGLIFICAAPQQNPGYASGDV